MALNGVKWNAINGVFKALVKTLIISCKHMFGEYIQTEFHQPELRRLCRVWDKAFTEWVSEESHLFFQSDTYALLLDVRNIAFTIIDNDNAYLTLLRKFIKYWPETAEEQ